MGENKIRIDIEGFLTILPGILVVVAEIVGLAQVAQKIVRDRVDLQGPFKLALCLCLSAFDRQERSVPVMRRCITRFDLYRSFELIFGPGSIPFVKYFEKAKRSMRFAKIGIDLKGFFNSGVSLNRI